MTQGCLRNDPFAYLRSRPYTTFFMGIMIISTAIIMGCIGEEQSPRSKRSIEVVGLEEELKAFYNKTHYYNFTVKSHLPRDCVVNISEIEWKDVLTEGAKAPNVVFYVDEPLSTNGTERKYIGNSSAKAFLPTNNGINITMTIKNIDPAFRSGILCFKILAFYAGGEKASSKAVEVLIRYM